MKPPRGHSNTDAYIDLVLAEAERDASPAPEINDTLACEPPDFSDIPDPEAAPLDEFDEEEPTHAFDRERGGAAPADPWRAPPPARVTGAPLKAKRTPPKAPPSLEMPFVAEPSVMIDLPELIEIKPAASPMEAGPRGAWARAGDLPSDSVIFELPEMSAVLEEEETPPRPRAVPRLGALAAEVTLDAAAARAAR
ncbi:hypothetical protein KJ940_18565, partial [Myxococcota bacterium]|nr:hypothetical protein [Myxococcota bacterium]